MCAHFCKLLDHMGEHDYVRCVPVAPPDLETRPLLDFDAGYIQRAVAAFPRQGSHAPWATSVGYRADVKVLRHSSVVDPALEFTRRADVPAMSRERA